MALNSEPGSASAESYVSVSDADAYHSARGNTAWTGEATAKEAALRRATDYLDAHYRGRWTGRKSDAEQALAWPRSGACDEDGNEIDDDIIPTVVKNATFESALREIQSPNGLQPDVTRGAIKSESKKVGPLEKTIVYADGASPVTVRTIIDNLLSGVLSGSASVSFVMRA